MGAGFHLAHRWELDWEDDVDLLTLRNGVKVKVLFEAPDGDQVDMLIRFPAGYVEPEHTHDSSHSVLVLEGEQVVRGEPLRPGDYLWAAGPEPHGPFEYPEGCVVFASFRGRSSQHLYPGSPAGDSLGT